MLRSVRFKNFVRFKEHQMMDFSSDGPFVFIGENGSGKSSVLEGIRRCLKLKLSTSISSVFNSREMSYFICNAETDVSGSKENVIFGIVYIEQTKNDNNGNEEHNAYNSIDIIETESKQSNKMRYYKFAMNDSERYLMKIDLIGSTKTTESETKLFVSKSYIVSDPKTLKSRKRLSDKTSTDDVIDFCLREIFGNLDKLSHEPTSLLETLLQDLAKQFVFTFSSRAIGPLQWSESDFISFEHRKNNYLEAKKKCEIIKFFLNDNDEKEFDKKKEQKIFQWLTQSTNYNFDEMLKQEENATQDEKLRHDAKIKQEEKLRHDENLQQGELKQNAKLTEEANLTQDYKLTEGEKLKHDEKLNQNENLKQVEKLNQDEKPEQNANLKIDTEVHLPDGKFALLKTPEGILEAKIFSILMSSKQYKTILLEEPDRGMHPQLVERMILKIKQEKNDKRVILTTHQKGFITPWTVSESFIFRRLEKKIRITSGMSIFDGKGNSNIKKIRLVTENLIISGKSIFDGVENANMKKMRLVTSHHVPDIFFANKVLFYEGESENLFLRELKSQILSGEHSTALKKLYGDDDEVAKCLVEYTFIKMNGEGNRDIYRTVSNKLKLDHLFLVDRDAVDLPSKLGISKEEIEKKLESKEDCRDIRKKLLDIRRELLEKNYTYFWLDGDIEKMVTAMCDDCIVLKEALRELNVISKNDELLDGVLRCKIAGKTKKKKNKKKKLKIKPKLFLHDDINSYHISKSVSHILEHFKQGNDLAEFINIFIKNT